MWDEGPLVWPRVIHVARKGRVLRPSPTAPGVFGLDLTAGCLHGCAYCHIRGASRWPGADRVLFDPFSAEALETALNDLGGEVQRVVLSPSSDPFPPHRGIRAEAVRAVQVLLRRGIPIVLTTRGRIPKALFELLAEHAELVRVALGVLTLNRAISRALEPRAASPRGRIRDLTRLVASGVTVEARFEPLVPGLTDTRENVIPLFEALASAGVRRVVTHYLFLHLAMTTPLEQALSPLGWSERLRDAFEGGRVFPIGTIGSTKHLPVEIRREGLARLIAWGAQYGLIVETGAAQNPDLPRIEPPRLPRPRSEPSRSAVPVDRTSDPTPEAIATH